MDNSPHRRTFCFRSYNNQKLKVKLWWLGVRGRKTRAYFVPLILPEGNFCNIWVLAQYIIYWICFQNIFSFTYKKTTFLLAFKITESLQCILKCIFLFSSLKACWCYALLLLNLSLYRLTKVILILKRSVRRTFSNWNVCRFYWNVVIYHSVILFMTESDLHVEQTGKQIPKRAPTTTEDYLRKGVKSR